MHILIFLFEIKYQISRKLELFVFENQISKCTVKFFVTIKLLFSMTYMHIQAQIDVANSTGFIKFYIYFIIIIQF